MRNTKGTFDLEGPLLFTKDVAIRLTIIIRRKRFGHCGNHARMAWFGTGGEVNDFLTCCAKAGHDLETIPPMLKGIACQT
jgi:hypothetical protein